MERRVPTREEALAYLEKDRNWGRWGKDDSIGAVNLIDDRKRLAAARLVSKGRAVSLSREFPKTPAPNNPTPAQHFMKRGPREPGGGAATDYYGVAYHGQANTHLDALCHIWDRNGMWNGRKPDDVITFDGANFGSVENWKDGIVTRGVLLDVPRFRKEPFVTLDKPVHGWELEDVAQAQGVKLEPGDAVCVYSGREKYNAANPVIWGGDPRGRPGLHASCLKFIRQSDCAMFVWDMMDAMPNEYNMPWTVHGMIFAYGVALLDNALLEPLADVCAQEGRYEFMLMVCPLRVVGGTGSPVNPIAMF